MRHTITSRLQPRGKVSKQVVALQERFDELGTKRAKVSAEQREATIKAKELSEQLTTAYASAELEVIDGQPRPTGGEVKKLEVSLAKAQAEVEAPWTERVEAIDRAQERVRSQHETLIRENRDELISELVPQAVESNEEAQEALEALRAALVTRAAYGRELEQLLNVTEGPGRGRFTDGPAEVLARDLADAQLEPPIPNLLKSAA